MRAADGDGGVVLLVNEIADAADANTHGARLERRERALQGARAEAPAPAAVPPAAVAREASRSSVEVAAALCRSSFGDRRSSVGSTAGDSDVGGDSDDEETPPPAPEPVFRV